MMSRKWVPFAVSEAKANKRRVSAITSPHDRTAMDVWRDGLC